MKPLIALFALAASGSALAAPGGPIGSLPAGTFTCELPGDAAGRAGVELPGAGFSITSAANYVADGARGTYLLTGDVLSFTSGPRAGQRYQVRSASYLRLLDAAGRTAPQRCVRHVGTTR